MAGNRVARVFDRLIGLETEYALRVRPWDRLAPRPSRFRVYEQVIEALGQRIPVAAARHFKEGVFLANGGAVWFEAERPSAGGGLIEGSTPECRSPRDVLVYQRAQDRLLAESARESRFAGLVCLIKNDRDGRDNIYGAQENYEEVLAQGLDLFLWRLGLLLLFPIAVATWLAILGCVIGTLAYFGVAGLAYVAAWGLRGNRQSLAIVLFGRDLAEGRSTCLCVPVWLESALQVVTRAVTAPLAAALYVLLRVSAFRRVRRQLLPFLLTRPIWAGAGMVDASGRFLLSDKGPSINCVLGFGGMFFDRPVFTMGHFFKAMYAEAWFSPREYFHLFASRHRLQIGLGDSNMCEPAEYLRVGATLLVLDAIDAGMLEDCPVVRRPIQALRAVCQDLSLRSRIALKGNRAATALEIQRFYHAACLAFLNGQDRVPAEALEVLSLWGRTLDALQEAADRGQPPSALFGSVDWVTKKHLLDRAASEANWSARKKIDIRYHELSPGGYYEMLKAAGGAVCLVTPAELDRATRNAPAGTPATMRGRYIREFARGQELLQVNWKTVTIGRGWGARVIRLARYGREAAAQARGRRRRPRYLDTEP